MGLSEDIKDLKDSVKVLTDEKEQAFKKKWKPPKAPIPKKFDFQRKKASRDGKIFAIVLKKNRMLEFKWGIIEGGLIKIGDYEFKAYEEKAIYFYKKFSVVVIFEDRLTLAGGVSEDAESRIIGGEKTHAVSEALGIGDFAQQTIIRIIEKIEIDKEHGKKKGKMPIVWIIIGIVIIIYFFTQGGF